MFPNTEQSDEIVMVKSTDKFDNGQQIISFLDEEDEQNDLSLIQQLKVTAMSQQKKGQKLH